MHSRFILVAFASLQCSLAEGIAKPIIVFDASFEQGDKIAKQWKLQPAKECIPTIEKSPKGNRVFLGRLPQKPQRLILTKLPKHQYLHVQFDLILAGSWDGTSKAWGPDTWQFKVDDAAPPIHGTFCCGAGELKQSFPDFINEKFPVNKAWDGSNEKGTLGYRWEAVEASAVYKVDFILPHTAPDATLSFLQHSVDVGGKAKDHDWSQWYGLDNVKITVLAEHKQISINEAKQHLQNINFSKKPKERYLSRRALIASDQTLYRIIEENHTKLDAKTIDTHVRNLSSEKFKTRVAATKHLISRCTPSDTKLLATHLEKTHDPEVKSRIIVIIKSIKAGGNTDQIDRVQQLLKIINTPKAKALLRKME